MASVSDDCRFFDLMFQRPDSGYVNVGAWERTFDRFKLGNGDEAVVKKNAFGGLIRALLTFPTVEDSGLPTPDQIVDLVYRVFDKDHDDALNRAEFQDCFGRWMQKILFPKCCLLIVDVQNDFIDGSLALRNGPAQQEGGDVIPVINGLLEQFRFATVAYSQDWHPTDHCSFFDNVARQTFHPTSQISKENAKLFDTVVLSVDGLPMEQTLFPVHCVQDTHGAQFHSNLKVVDKDDLSTVSITVKKGHVPKPEWFSAFEDVFHKHRTDLHKFLQENKITDVFICGLAYDFCVGASAMDALMYGYRMLIVEDAVRGVCDDSILRMKDKFTAQHGGVIRSAQIDPMMTGAWRSPQLAVQTLHYLLKTV